MAHPDTETNIEVPKQPKMGSSTTTLDPKLVENFDSRKDKLLRRRCPPKYLENFIIRTNPRKRTH